jgi:S1-C subfamily serine protease
VRILARRASPAVVSLTVTRSEPLPKVPVPNPRTRQVMQVDRYAGPYTGVCVSRNEILTTTTNLVGFKTITKIEAHLADGRILPAEVVARDKFRALALLRVEAEDLPVLEPVDQDDVEAGRFVLALGDPFGDAPHAGPLLTFGVVSALHKLGPRMDAVQTDAGLNDANVGGPLVDFQGRLVGVSLLVQPDRFGRNSGVGFAVPVWTIQGVLEELRKGVDIEAGYLGIMGLEPIPGGLFRFPKVVPDGPAFRGGLRDGDVLLRFDGKRAQSFADPQEIIAALHELRPGDVLVLEVKRGSDKLELRVTLGTRPEE